MLNFEKASLEELCGNSCNEGAPGIAWCLYVMLGFGSVKPRFVTSPTPLGRSKSAPGGLLKRDFKIAFSVR